MNREQTCESCKTKTQNPLQYSNKKVVCFSCYAAYCAGIKSQLSNSNKEK